MSSSSSPKRPRLRLELPPSASCSAFDTFRSGGGNLAISRQRSEQAPPSAATPARRLWLCPDDDLGRQAADRASEERSQLWTDRYGPASTEELCLHKKKLLELEACLSCRPRLVFVHGPCGAGKSVAVRLLCDRLRLGSAYLDEELDACANGPAEAMQALIRLARFRQARVIVWDEPTLSLSFADQQQQQLKFGSSSGDTAALRALLDEFLARCLDVCLVLISCNDRLLPRDWLEDNNATLVQVNPVARTQLIRSLNAILTKRHLRPASYKSLIESVAAAADGDIRAAVSGLQFSLQFALCTAGIVQAAWPNRCCSETRPISCSTLSANCCTLNESRRHRQRPCASR
ncbi:hypothetical protein BOX15_Mlig002438g9 [Macrostomum lignano]|uniref:AAA+ ATPase domain-containing protein n=1 Tax=Macrostomum lignano TaxID=282301 RepID=A0A267DWV9_9PLAT|nr:hypothetical protein BOX15_Mlig002438g9 [Macrostomum lignano]